MSADYYKGLGFLEGPCAFIIISGFKGPRVQRSITEFRIYETELGA